MADITTSSVSILLQTYNHEAYVLESVQSLLDQTWSDFELLIVDDCSTDETWRLLQRYRGLPGLRMVRNASNLGQHASTNLHLTCLSGEFVLLASGDDVYYPRLLEGAIGLFEREDTMALVHFNGHIMDASGRPQQLFSDWYDEELGRDAYAREIAARLRQDYVVPGRTFRRDLILTKNLVPSHSACLVRRTLLDLAGPFDETLPQVGDYDMWLRLALYGNIGYLAQPLVGWRRHFTSASAALEASGRALSDFLILMTRMTRASPPTLGLIDARTWRRYARRCVYFSTVCVRKGMPHEALVLMTEAARTCARFAFSPVQNPSPLKSP